MSFRNKGNAFWGFFPAEFVPFFGNTNCLLNLFFLFVKTSHDPHCVLNTQLLVWILLQLISFPFASTITISLVIGMILVFFPFPFLLSTSKKTCLKVVQELWPAYKGKQTTQRANPFLQLKGLPTTRRDTHLSHSFFFSWLSQPAVIRHWNTFPFRPPYTHIFHIYLHSVRLFCHAFSGTGFALPVFSLIH